MENIKRIKHCSVEVDITGIKLAGVLGTGVGISNESTTGCRHAHQIAEKHKSWSESSRDHNGAEATQREGALEQSIKFGNNVLSPFMLFALFVVVLRHSNSISVISWL